MVIKLLGILFGILGIAILILLRELSLSTVCLVISALLLWEHKKS